MLAHPLKPFPRGSALSSIQRSVLALAAALAGADASTIPADVFKALVKHPLTDKGLDAFLADWGKTGQSIL